MVERKPRKRSEVLKEKVEEAQKTALQKSQDHTKRIKEAVNAVAATENGRYFLREMMNYAGFGRSKTGIDAVARVVDANSTLYNAALENSYLHFRKMIRREHLIKIEYYNQED